MKCKAGQVVVYGCQGVCRMEQVAERVVGGKKSSYYLLKPIYNKKSAIFVPCDNDKLTQKMRPVMTKGEVENMIDSISTKSGLWLESEPERKERYHQIIVNGTNDELMDVIIALYNHRLLRSKEGKRLHVAVERAFKEAGRLIYEQIAYVLNILPDDVPDYISKRISAITV